MRLSSKAAEMGIKAQDSGKDMNGFKRCPHLRIANNVSDHNDFSSRITGFELNDRLDGDVVVSEAAANAADHTWCIFCFETHIISLTCLLRVC